jgi:predicted nucleic acid-binding protein
MKVFGDAVYFIALLSARDRWHAHARAINQNPPGPLVTTEWILTEVGDAFSQPAMRQKFIQLLHLLTRQPDVKLSPLAATCFDEGWNFMVRGRTKSGR